MPHVRHSRVPHAPARAVGAGAALGCTATIGGGGRSSGGQDITRQQVVLVGQAVVQCPEVAQQG